MRATIQSCGIGEDPHKLGYGVWLVFEASSLEQGRRFQLLIHICGLVLIRDFSSLRRQYLLRS